MENKVEKHLTMNSLNIEELNKRIEKLEDRVNKLQKTCRKLYSIIFDKEDEIKEEIEEFQEFVQDLLTAENIGVSYDALIKMKEWQEENNYYYFDNYDSIEEGE